MTPSLIENAADLCVGNENCSSNIENGGSCPLTESEIRRKAGVSSSLDYSGNGCTTTSTPRFALRKRSMTDDQRGHVISSYNSDFLSGIFADIAKVASSEESDPNLDVSLPSKKSRISLTKSISRCARSCANLAAVSPTPDQGRRLVKIPLDANKTQRASKKGLHHCVSTSSNEENSLFGKLAFPQLPSSVTTEPSTFTLTPKNKGQQPPAALETPSASKDYGWFVEMDDECTGLSVNAYNNLSQKNLAFLAPTAPNGVDNEAEVEWAKAADTVDDVLGDFF